MIRNLIQFLRLLFLNVLQLLLEENQLVRDKIPDIFEFLIAPHFEKVDEAISPGLTSLKWNSLDIDGFVGSVQTSLRKLDLLITRVTDILTMRIDGEMTKASTLVLCELPDGDPWTTEKFLQVTSVRENWQSHTSMTNYSCFF